MRAFKSMPFELAKSGKKPPLVLAKKLKGKRSTGLAAPDLISKRVRKAGGLRRGDRKKGKVGKICIGDRKKKGRKRWGAGNTCRGTFGGDQLTVLSHPRRRLNKIPSTRQTAS